MKLLAATLLLLGISAALASCPNDCSGHGACNQYSACECYRNYMGADCSERMCAFGRAFVDTPQGDLNADGVVERPDTLTFVLGKTSSFFEEWSTWFGEAHYDESALTGDKQALTTQSTAAQADASVVTMSCVVSGTGTVNAQEFVRRIDQWKGYYLEITFDGTSPAEVETRKIVSNTECDTGTFQVTVETPFTFRNPVATTDDYRIMPTGTTAATFPATAAGGCPDGDCGAASFFSLADFPAHGIETMYKFMSPVAASTEITTDGAAVITGVPTVQDAALLADCNTKFGISTITHAIRVHAKAESVATAYDVFPIGTTVGDPVNDQLQVPEWTTPSAAPSTGAEGIVEQLSLYPETFYSPVSKVNRFESEVLDSGASANTKTFFEITAETDGTVAYDAALGVLAASKATSAYGTDASGTGAYVGTTDDFVKYIGARVTVCFGMAPLGASNVYANGKGNCESRTIYEYGFNALSTGAAGNYITVRTPFSQIPKAKDLVIIDWLDMYGPSGITNRNGVADTTDDYDSSTPKIFVCSPGPDTPPGSEVKAQWDPDSTWESFPDEHGHARFGTGSASLTWKSGVNTGELTNAVQVTKKGYWDEAHFYRECSAKGKCDRSSGKCDCFPGFSGTGCAQLACPNDCSGHGQCRRILDTQSMYVSWDVDKTTKCVCEAGYSGLDCSQRKCPKGDDPVTRSGVNEIQSFGLTGEQHAQLIMNSAQSSEFVHNMFALEFEDEMGDKWVTHQIDFTTGNHAHFWDSEAHMMRQPTKVAEGLTDGTGSATGVVVKGAANFAFHEMAAANRPDATPFDNYYLTTVVEAVSDSNEFAIDTAQIPVGGYADATGVTWSANPWAGGGETASDTNRHTTIPDAAMTYFVTTKDYTVDYSLAKRVETALESLPNNVIENVEVSVDLHKNLARADDVGALTVRVTFLENSGDIPMMGVRYCWAYGQQKATLTHENVAMLATKGAYRGEMNVQCNQADGSFTDANGYALNPFGEASPPTVTCTGNLGDVCAACADKSGQLCTTATDTGTGTCNIAVASPTSANAECEADATQIFGSKGFLTIAETVKGSKGNDECSNRGLCDYGTGLCKCFNGYTDFDCSVQNSLASS